VSKLCYDTDILALNDITALGGSIRIEDGDLAADQILFLAASGGFYILAIAIVIAGALSGGFYSVSNNATGPTIINRLTGTIWDCTAAGCERVSLQQ
jgi:hypothetical protein